MKSLIFTFDIEIESKETKNKNLELRNLKLNYLIAFNCLMNKTYHIFHRKLQISNSDIYTDSILISFKIFVRVVAASKSKNKDVK